MRSSILRIAALMFLVGCDEVSTTTNVDSDKTMPAQRQTMKVFWNDSGRGLESNAAKNVDLAEAGLIWSDEVRGTKGNFFGLIDDEDRTIQFYFDEDIPDHVEDASHLRIVRLDFPVPAMEGSYGKQVTIGEVHGLINRAFEVGADHRQFDGVTFTPW